VQRGHRVGTLQEMFEEIREISAVDDLLQMTDELGMTPLLWASKRGFADIVEVLLTFAGDVQAVISARDAEGSTPLHHAARRHHNDIVAMLIEGTLIACGWPALHASAHHSAAPC